ncbi:MAG: heparan-alpha-glucosaminide N-acetyltransferase domain-containing protein [Eubacteriales bacterium]|nr:heparan-alpha-glucosaminide N-acetyltransferase domain-containing protein [Eubacteriales bacterium]
MKHSPERRNGARERLQGLDSLRGLTLVSMILYHAMWDLLYLPEAGAAGAALRPWYEGTAGRLWQQSICRTFIFLSGFCVPLSVRIFRRGLLTSCAGLAVSAVTILAMYEERIVFGILTFLGAAMLLCGAAGLHRTERWNAQRGKRIPPAPACAVCLILFYMTRWVNRGTLRLWPGRTVPLPQALSAGGPAGVLLTALGFPMPGFFSTDYFSLFPWIFLFCAGTFLHLMLREKHADLFSHPLLHLRIPVLDWMGRHSLFIYLLHQPVLYLAVLLL